MSETTIEWTATPLPDGTALPGFSFNPWIGCTAISPGCKNCYAEALARRLRVKFGPGETRRPASERTWSEPIKWNAQAKKAGIRRKAFSASMADIFDNEGLAAEREWLWEMVEETSHLDWLMLTKRIGNVMEMIPERWREQLPGNVWIGATIVNQEEADRDVPKLLRVPAAVRFLSCEPLLGPINLRHLTSGVAGLAVDALTGFWEASARVERRPGMDWRESLKDIPTLPAALPKIDWVIAGGESGHGARAMNPAWVRALRDQCVGAGVPFLFKQWGQFLPGCDPKASQYAWEDDRCVHEWDESEFGYSIRVRSKKEAGRELDGRTWDEFPRSAA